MAQKFAILFDGDSKLIYYEGQTVSGHVLLQNQRLFKLRGIRLEVTGSARVSWERGNNTKYYTGREEYMNFQIELVGSRGCDSEISLPPSVHKFPFTFRLPGKLPQSFEGKHGNIRYKVKAVIHRSIIADDYAEVSLTVLRPLDLNLEPTTLLDPILIESQYTATSLTCVRGFISGSFTLNKKCFVPGETIRIDGGIINRTDGNIAYTTIAFVQDIEFRAINKNGNIYAITHERRTLASIRRPPIQSGYSDSWENIDLVVPDIPSSRLDGCRIMSINYFVEASATFYELCTTSISVPTEVIIGGIAIQDFVVTSQPRANSISYQYVLPSLPSYESCVGERGVWPSNCDNTLEIDSRHLTEETRNRLEEGDFEDIDIAPVHSNCIVTSTTD